MENIIACYANHRQLAECIKSALIQLEYCFNLTHSTRSNYAQRRGKEIEGIIESRRL